jgi:hypothetical protein
VPLLLPHPQKKVKVQEEEGGQGGKVLNENRIRARRERMQQANAKSFPTEIDEDNIIDWFTENNQLDYTVTEVARGMDHVYNSLKYHIQKMDEQGMLVRVRRMGNGWTYQLPQWLTSDRQREVQRLVNI